MNYDILRKSSWQAFERIISRLLLYEGYTGIRLVGQTGDRGADILAYRGGKRWLFQVKHWKNRVGVDVIDQTLKAMTIYRAHVPVIVSLSGFDEPARQHQQVLMSRGIPLQLWDSSVLISRAERIPEAFQSNYTIRDYQEEAIQQLVKVYTSGNTHKALIVMATGLGKTLTSCEAIRRINSLPGHSTRVMVLAHTNPLVYQFERAFWPFLSKKQQTVVWNLHERPTEQELTESQFIFACINSVASYVENGGELPLFDIILVDECHHVGGKMYDNVIKHLQAGNPSGPFLIGLTATPWRPDETDLYDYFGEPLVSIDIVTGLKNGFLSNVDYRMYTDNIKWEAIKGYSGNSFSPRQINRTLFITQWDDAVVYALQSAWAEQEKPRAIVFCGTIDHAITMRDRINALGFCNAAAIYSQTATGISMETFERNRILCDFGDGIIDVVCAVDIFNEGIDVPDVNILVFQRVTHSRRIFIQQLGRGLRIAADKEKVIVLDFVSDIRRFAAGLDLKNRLEGESNNVGRPIRINLPHKVTFRRVGGEDPEAETFLRHWLEDVTAIENAGEDASILKFPPQLPGGR